MRELQSALTLVHAQPILLVSPKARTASLDALLSSYLRNWESLCAARVAAPSAAFLVVSTTLQLASLGSLYTPSIS